MAIASKSTLIFDRFLSMGQIELFDHLTVCKQMTDV